MKQYTTQEFRNACEEDELASESPYYLFCHYSDLRVADKKVGSLPTRKLPYLAVFSSPTGVYKVQGLPPIYLINYEETVVEYSFFANNIEPALNASAYVLHGCPHDECVAQPIDSWWRMDAHAQEYNDDKEGSRYDKAD